MDVVAAQADDGVDRDVVALLGVKARHASDDERIGGIRCSRRTRTLPVSLKYDSGTGSAFGITCTWLAGTPSAHTESRVPADTARIRSARRAAAR